MSALQLPVVLTKLAYLIDNPWTVSLDRANAAGLILADSLVDRNLGTRPITLVGYSLGSRVIFSCLRELARKGAFGLVQNVYLFGSPIVANRDDYLKARAVVSGRFVNGYARNDWILGYLFRLTSGGISRVAGLAPILGVPGLENIDVTEIVPGHMAYRTAMPKLLREIGWLVDSDEFNEIEDPDPDNHQQRQRELINDIEEARKELERQNGKDKGKWGIFGRKKKAEKKEWETYEESRGEDEASGSGSKESTYGGVLFDVDAIRAELASEHMEVKELQSTLPPMKLDIRPQTLSPRGSLRETKSFDTSTLTASTTTASALTSATIGSATTSATTAHSAYAPYYEDDDEFREKEVSLTFESNYSSPVISGSSFYKSSKPLPTPPRADVPDRAAVALRPELKSSTTMPVGLGIGGADLDHNAWADEDDEFAEKEVQMTFA
jgi:hypothetical protein